MKTTLRSILRLSLLILALGLLPACGGGGGGGGGGGPITPVADLVPPAIILEDGTPSPLPAGDDIIVGAGSGQIVFYGVDSRNLQKTDLGIVVSDGVTFYNGTGGKASDFFAGDTFISAQKTTELPAVPTNTAYKRSQNRHAIYLGGKVLGLEYADFGIWLASGHSQEIAVDGSLISETKKMPSGAGFWTDTGAHTQAPVNGQNFAGTAIAVASVAEASTPNEPYDSAMLSGTAELSISDPGSGLTGTLNLLFPGYHNFTLANIGIDGSGAMSGPTSDPVSGHVSGVWTTGGIGVTGTPSTENQNFSFDTVQGASGRLGGQFYGDGINVSREAAGYFGISGTSQGSTDIVRVNGAFGVVGTALPQP